VGDTESVEGGNAQSGSLGIYLDGCITPKARQFPIDVQNQVCEAGIDLRPPLYTVNFKAGIWFVFPLRDSVALLMYPPRNYNQFMRNFTSEVKATSGPNLTNCQPLSSRQPTISGQSTVSGQPPTSVSPRPASSANAPAPRPKVEIAPIVGGAVGGSVALLTAMAGVLLWWRRRRRTKSHRSPDDPAALHRVRPSGALIEPYIGVLHTGVRPYAKMPSVPPSYDSIVETRNSTMSGPPPPPPPPSVLAFGIGSEHATASGSLLPGRGSSPEVRVSSDSELEKRAQMYALYGSGQQ
jgi:hypothetical protein